MSIKIYFGCYIQVCSLKHEFRFENTEHLSLTLVLLPYRAIVLGMN